VNWKALFSGQAKAPQQVDGQADTPLNAEHRGEDDEFEGLKTRGGRVAPAADVTPASLVSQGPAHKDCTAIMLPNKKMPRSAKRANSG
jgi:hypothetical protein